MATEPLAQSQCGTVLAEVVEAKAHAQHPDQGVESNREVAVKLGQTPGPEPEKVQRRVDAEQRKQDDESQVLERAHNTPVVVADWPE